MKLKTLIIVVAVLAMLAGAITLFNRPATAPVHDARVGQPLVALTSADKVARLRLTDSGKTVDLVRSADNTWRVASYYDLPADFSKLATFISNLTTTKIASFITSNPTTLARLEFKDTRIELLDATGASLLDLGVGKTDNAGGRFIHYGQENTAYLVPLESFFDTDGKNWADPALLKLTPDDVAKIELTFPTGDPLVATRATKDAPFASAHSPDGQQLKSAALTNLLGSLAPLRFTDTAPTDDANAVAAKSATRTVKLTTFDNKTVTFALGRKPEEKKLKPPAPKPADATTPSVLVDPATKPAASIADLTNKVTDTTAAIAAATAKPAEPEFDTIPAGPVFAFVTHSDASAPINTFMQKRAFQVSENLFVGLPEKSADLFEPISPPPAPTTTPAANSAPAAAAAAAPKP